MGNMTPYKMRPYQIDAVRAGLDAFKRKAREVLVLPTGSGKSLVIANIARMLGGTTIVFQPSAEILVQNLEKAHAYGIEDIGVFSASMKQKTVGQLTFATIGSIHNRPELWDKFDHVLVDECHLIGNDGGMYEQFIEAHGGAVVGLTATPYRLHTFNNMETGDRSAVVKLLTRTRPRTFTKISHVTQISQLYDQGFLAPLVYTQNPSYNHRDIGLNSTGGDFNDAKLKEYNKKMKVEEAVADAVGNSGRKHILVFTKFVEDAELLKAMLNETGISCETVSADTPADKRKAVLEGFRNGSIKVVANVGVLTTGFDFPELDCVILARPTQSVALYYQMVGRAMRPTREKKNAAIIDICGNVRRFGRVETFNLDMTGLGRLKSEAGFLTGFDFVSNTDMEKKQTGTDVVNFGKHSGKRLFELPQEYLVWAVSTFDVGSKWHTAFIGELNRRIGAKV